MTKMLELCPVSGSSTPPLDKGKSAGNHYREQSFHNWNISTILLSCEYMFTTQSWAHFQSRCRYANEDMLSSVLWWQSYVSLPQSCTVGASALESWLGLDCKSSLCIHLYVALIYYLFALDTAPEDHLPKRHHFLSRKMETMWAHRATHQTMKHPQ